jgi:fumarate hydratase, class II
MPMDHISAALEPVEFREEVDSFGSVRVPADRLWGAQTQRSVDLFNISTERIPKEIIVALAQIKRAAAQANQEFGLLSDSASEAIRAAASEVIAGQHDDEFPLSVWQTGSGTQSHMNMNEVLANRASEILGGSRGKGRLIHPNDEVNRGQSSNDVFSAAMNVAALQAVVTRVRPALVALWAALNAKAGAFANIIKVGRTHLQDATPLTLGQEFSGWVSQLQHAITHLDSSQPHLEELAVGGTAVGTGLNTHPQFGQRVAALLTNEMTLSFRQSPNTFEALSAHDAIVFAHGALKTLAVALLKIASDIRLLASGPRSGIGELSIPANEPGSSIMPGKANPTQCEALIMCCMQVMGNDTTVGLAGCSGILQLNVCKPLIAHCFLQSAALLADGMDGFREHLVEGIEANVARIDELLRGSLMLATALNPHIGYDRAAAIAKRAHAEGLSLREAAISSGYVTGEQFDTWVRPENMVAAAVPNGN